MLHRATKASPASEPAGGRWYREKEGLEPICPDTSEDGAGDVAGAGRFRWTFRARRGPRGECTPLRSVRRLHPPSPAAAPLRSLERPLFVCRQGPPPLFECPVCVEGVKCLFDRTRSCPVLGCRLSHLPPSSASRDTAQWRSCQDDLASARGNRGSIVYRCIRLRSLRQEMCFPTMLLAFWLSPFSDGFLQ